MESSAPVTDSEALEALGAIGEVINLRLSRKQAGLPSCERMGVGRHGRSTYGVHVLCHAEYEAGACTVVSYGVEHNYWFELELANRTGCRVVACDPTVRHPPRLGPNVFFKPWGAPASTPRLMCGPRPSPRMRPNCSRAALLPEPRIGVSWRTVGPSLLTRLATAQRFADEAVFSRNLEVLIRGGDRPSHRLLPPGRGELRSAVGPTEAIGRRLQPGGRGSGADAPAAPLAVLKMDCEGCEYSLYADTVGQNPLFFSTVDQFALEVHLSLKWVPDNATFLGYGRLLALLRRSGRKSHSVKSPSLP
mmetsp:Transcript_47475/g.148487  ORF Transcript_47475/g.148487 Transcript_47475/m.148487 type:complete len:305 (+) Transcript_47475:51-965(+)